jgi:hypothetical protein
VTALEAKSAGTFAGSGAEAGATVVVVLNTSGTDGSSQDGYGTTDVLRNMEDIRGSEYADSITGNELAN